MGGETCELCGHTSRDMETHHIVPKDITSQAGMPDSATVALCSNCHQEVHAWYSRKVYDMTYDTATKRFKPKSLSEITREYEAAYRLFAGYKKRQQKKR